MNDDFEQRLRTRFAASHHPPVDERFSAGVRARIVALRRARRMILTATVAATGLAIAIFAAPLLVVGTALIAAAPDTLNGALSALLISPAGYLLGALTASAALAAVLNE
jgi:hypothetical protein